LWQQREPAALEAATVRLRLVLIQMQMARSARQALSLLLVQAALAAGTVVCLLPAG
jgi:hypothetical protein